jgi:ribosomal RNA-processing protein 9
LFDLSVLGYVETLFGHQDSVIALDALRNETAVSVGGRDKTIRFWKVVEETQLLFRGGARSAIRELLEGGALEGLDEDGDGDEGDEGHDRGKPKDRRGKARKFVEGSIECVAMIDETTFVSGGDSG